MIPVAGSAYTYAYAVLGELVAWIIGWDLLLEYALVVAVVSIGWSGYLQALLSAVRLHASRLGNGRAGNRRRAMFWTFPRCSEAWRRGPSDAARRMGRALQHGDGDHQIAAVLLVIAAAGCRMWTPPITTPSCLLASAAWPRAPRSCSSRSSATTR